MSPDDDLLLHRFLAAIEAAEARPTEADLADAPSLDHWRPMLTLFGVPLLWGRVRRHPLLGDTVITTSPLVALDPEAGWARTFSRWYNLGVPFDILQDTGRECPQGRGGLDVIGFDFPDLVPIDDPDQLARLLALRIEALRRLARRTQH